MAKCVTILMEVLKKLADHETLLELALQLQRTPEPDKYACNILQSTNSLFYFFLRKYLNDVDKKELLRDALESCIQTFRNLLSSLAAEKKERDILNLMVDIYKAHRKCIKHMQQKEGQFAVVMVEAYKVYIKDRMTLPDNANFMDLAVKMCQQELNHRKNLEKGIFVQPASSAVTQQKAQQHIGSIEVKSVSDINKTVSAAPASTTVTPPAANKGNGNSSSARSRGRVASKNVNPAASVNAMHSMYMKMLSDPLLASQYQQNPFASNLLLGNSANIFGGLNAQQLNLLLAQSLATTSTAPMQQPQQKAQAKAMSAYEAKYLESLASAAGSLDPFSGIKQNLLSNSLSITTTSMTTAMTNTTTITPSKKMGK